MIFEFNKKETNNKMGNKAKFLIEMMSAKFNVPNGFVLDSGTYLDILKNSKIDNRINNYLSKINKDNIKEISKNICSLFN